MQGNLPSVRVSIIYTSWGLLALLTALSAIPLALAEQRLQTGQERVQAGELAPALTLYRQAARLAPLHPGPHHALATGSLDTSESLVMLDAAIRRDPRDPDLWARKAQALMAAERWSEAATAAGEALRLQPMLGVHYERAMVALAREAVQRYLMGEPTYGRQAVADALAVAAQLEERQAQAEPLKHLWRNSKPEVGGAYGFALGRVLALAGQYDAALPHLREAAVVERTRIEAEIWLYLTLQRLNRVEEALALEQRLWIRSLPINPLGRILDLATP